MFTKKIDIKDFPKKIEGIASDTSRTVRFLADSGRYKERQKWHISDRELQQKIGAVIGNMMEARIDQLIFEKILLESGSTFQKEIFLKYREEANNVAKKYLEKLYEVQHGKSTE